MSSLRFTISRLFSAVVPRSPKPMGVPTPDACADAVPASTSEKCASGRGFRCLLYRSYPHLRIGDPSPETPVYSKGEASPTDTLTPFHDVLGIDSLPYDDARRSGTTSTVISRLPSKHSDDLAATHSAETPAIPRAKSRLWCSFLIYVCIGWGDGGMPILYFLLSHGD